MGFWSGVKTGFVEAAVGTWEGAKGLAKGGYALATDSQAREHAWQATQAAAGAVGDYTAAVAQDPAKAWRDARDGALTAYSAADQFVRTADAETWGKLAGGGAFEIGTALIPIGAAAKAAKLGKLAKAGDKIGDAARALDKAQDIGDAVQDAGQAARALPMHKPSAVMPCAMTKTSVHRGLNQATWSLDAKGRPVTLDAHLKEIAGGSARSGAEQRAQGLAGKLGIAGDEGGHLLGHRFMDDQGVKNLFPQNANFNRSAYKTMENEWADWLASGREVKLKVSLEPPGAVRPDRVLVDYDVMDPKTGKVVFTRAHDFSNAAGEVFERVLKSHIPKF